MSPTANRDPSPSTNSPIDARDRGPSPHPGRSGQSPTPPQRASPRTSPKVSFAVPDDPREQSDSKAAPVEADGGWDWTGHEWRGGGAWGHAAIGRSAWQASASHASHRASDIASAAVNRDHEVNRWKCALDDNRVDANAQKSVFLLAQLDFGAADRIIDQLVAKAGLLKNASAYVHQSVQQARKDRS